MLFYPEVLPKGADMPEAWPELVMDAKSREAFETLRLWAQVVGKIRLARTPLVNHWWNVPLYVTPRGLTTSTIPHGNRTFQVDFDFISHRLILQTSAGESRVLALYSMPTSEFYYLVMEALHSLDVPVSIRTLPAEIPDPIPFELDLDHHDYDPDFSRRFWRVLSAIEPVFQKFRAGFQGKCSPVHFFWGGFDLAVSRFSGRTAPEHGPTPNTAASIVREAYSHEVSSCGFWPGGGPVAQPAFYSYAYPEPAGYRERRVEPEGAFFSADMGEFILPYARARESVDPEAALLAFLQSTYEAAADLGQWDRKALERAVEPAPALS
jgi:hypothetical protein